MLADRQRGFTGRIGRPVDWGAGYLTLDGLVRTAAEAGLMLRRIPTRGRPEWAFKRWLAGRKLRRQPASFGIWSFIDKVEAVDDLNVRFHYSRPTSLGERLILRNQIKPDSGRVVRGRTVLLAELTQELVDLPREMRVLEATEEVAKYVRLGKLELTASSVLERGPSSRTCQATSATRAASSSRSPTPSSSARGHSPRSSGYLTSTGRTRS